MVFPEFVLVSPQGTSSPSVKPGGSVPGGHVRGSARFHNDLTVGSVPLAKEEPSPSCCFRLMTLCTGSSWARLPERLESPKKYVPSPEIVPAATIPRVSICFMLVSRKCRGRGYQCLPYETPWTSLGFLQPPPGWGTLIWNEGAYSVMTRGFVPGGSTLLPSQRLPSGTVTPPTTIIFGTAGGWPLDG